MIRSDADFLQNYSTGCGAVVVAVANLPCDDAVRVDRTTWFTLSNYCAVITPLALVVARAGVVVSGVAAAVLVAAADDRLAYVVGAHEVVGVAAVGGGAALPRHARAQQRTVLAIATALAVFVTPNTFMRNHVAGL